MKANSFKTKLMKVIRTPENSACMLNLTVYYIIGKVYDMISNPVLLHYCLRCYNTIGNPELFHYW